jgi:hypothetical protein
MEYGMILLISSLIIFAVLVKAVAELLEKVETKRSDKPHLRQQL